MIEMFRMGKVSHKFLGERFYELKTRKIDLEIDIPGDDLFQAESRRLLLEFRGMFNLVGREYDIDREFSSLNKLYKKLSNGGITNIEHKRQMFQQIATMVQIGRTLSAAEINQVSPGIIRNLGIECDQGTIANLTLAAHGMQTALGMSGPDGKMNKFKNESIREAFDKILAANGNVTQEAQLRRRLNLHSGLGFDVHNAAYMNNLVSSTFNIGRVTGDTYANSMYMIGMFRIPSNHRGLVKYICERLDTRETVESIVNEIVAPFLLPVSVEEFTPAIAKQMKLAIDSKISDAAIIRRLTCLDPETFMPAYKESAKAIIRAWTIGAMSEKDLVTGPCKIMECRSMELLLEAMHRARIDVNGSNFIGSDILDLITAERINGANSRQRADLSYSLAAIKHELRSIPFELSDKMVINSKIDRVQEIIQARNQELILDNHQYALGRDSNTYKFLMKHDVETIARFLVKGGFADPVDQVGYNPTAIHSDALFESAPKELIGKMAQIALMVDKRHGAGRVSLLLSDVLDMFVNLLNWLVGQGVTNKDVANMLTELGVVSGQYVQRIGGVEHLPIESDAFKFRSYVEQSRQNGGGGIEVT